MVGKWWLAWRCGGKVVASVGVWRISGGNVVASVEVLRKSGG